MIDHVTSIADPLVLAAALLAGAVLGLAYFAAMRRTVDSHVTGQGWRLPVALTFGRLGVVVVVLTAASQFGAGPLLAVFAGFLITRTVVLRRERKGDAA